jgi:hypothetical protein
MVSPAGIFSAGDFSMQPISVEIRFQKKQKQNGYRNSLLPVPEK